MVAQTYQVSRKKQDEYAFISHTRASNVGVELDFVFDVTHSGVLGTR